MKGSPTQLLTINPVLRRHDRRHRKELPDRVVMKGDIIGTWDYEGHDRWCQRYAERLRS